MYDPEDGRLHLAGPAELAVDALFLRISADEAGTPADFEFQTGSAPWSDDRDIVLSDELDAQSFMDYRSAPVHGLESGDGLDSLLPAGLSQGALSNHLSAAYRVQGTPSFGWRTSPWCPSLLRWFCSLLEFSP